MNIPRWAAAVATVLVLLPAGAAAQEAGRTHPRESQARLIVLVKEIDAPVPLAGARIELTAPDESTVGPQLTDDAGRVVFLALVPGGYRIQIQRLGYRPVSESLMLEPSSHTTVTAELVPEALEMDPVLVAITRGARSRADMGGFDERRRVGMGTFVTREQIEERSPILVSDLFRTMAGIRVVPVSGGAYPDLLMRGNCRPALIVDGMHIPAFGGLVIDHYFTPQDVEAIEIYRGPQTPPRFHHGSCGAVVVWTRVPEPTDRRFSWRRMLIAAGILTGMFLFGR